jgi:hypothetical protein
LSHEDDGELFAGVYASRGSDHDVRPSLVGEFENEDQSEEREQGWTQHGTNLLSENGLRTSPAQGIVPLKVRGPLRLQIGFTQGQAHKNGGFGFAESNERGV